MSTRKGAKTFEVCPHTCKTVCLSDSTHTPLWRKEGSSCSRHAKNQLTHDTCTPECRANYLLRREVKGGVALSATQEELRKWVPIIRQQRRISDAILAHILDIAEADLDRLYPTGGDEDVAMEVEVEVDRNSQGAGAAAMEVDSGMLEGEGDVDLPVENIQRRPQLWRSRDTSEVSSVSEYSQLPTHLTTVASVEDPLLSPPKCFRLLYVPDPSRSCDSLVMAQHDLAYSTRTVPKEICNEMKNVVPNHIFFKRANPQKSEHDNSVSKVRICEWVSLLCINPKISVSNVTLALDRLQAVHNECQWVPVVQCHLHGLVTIPRRSGAAGKRRNR